MKRLVSTLIALVALSLLVPVTASALVQINRGIAGARLGNTKAQVRTALGNPNRIVTGTMTLGHSPSFSTGGGSRSRSRAATG